MAAQWLIGLAGLAGVLAWVRAAWTLTALMREAPDGEELAQMARLGMWQFAEVERVGGPSTRRHIAAFKSSVIAFVVAVIGGMVIGAFFWDPSLTPPDIPRQ